MGKIGEEHVTFAKRGGRESTRGKLFTSLYNEKG